ncbi:MAG: carboxypeptidase-like regulatory domain-containing protein, partial [Acidobacteriota bacterium]
AAIEAIEPPGAARASSDADGEFAISRTAAEDSETLVLRVSAEGYAAQHVHLGAEDQRRDEPFVVEMQPGGWIRALVGGRGDPCAGCRLSLLPGGPDLVTDSDGEAFSPALLPGWYRVEKPRPSSLGSTVVTVPRAEVRRVRVIAGEISTVRFDTGLPRVQVIFEDRLQPEWWLVSRTPWGEERVEPEADGSFLVPYRQGSAPELFLTRFDRPSGHEMEIRVATLRVGTLLDQIDEPRRFPLPKARIHGQVEDGENRRGLGGVRVRLQRVSDGAHSAEMHTRVDGSFDLPHVPEGVYSLVLGERAFQFVTVDARSRFDLGDFQLYPEGF